MDIILDQKEARVIGCLIEKQLSTPEYYPLSLNALTNACNQKTNRDPVTDYDETMVEEILTGLIDRKLVNKSGVGRVPKYEELLVGRFNFVPREAAIICELLLRGAQTAGELRGRTARLYGFESLEAVMETLSQLEGMGLIHRLPRLPGHKESRYSHLLCGPPDAEPETPVDRSATPQKVDSERLEGLEQEIAALRQEIAMIKEQFETFRKQFE